MESLRVALVDVDAVVGFLPDNDGAAGVAMSGKNLLDAIGQTSVNHVVLSTARNFSALSNGRLPVPVSDARASLEEYARLLKLPVTFLHIGLLYEELVAYLLPDDDSEDSLSFSFPMGNSRLAAIGLDDIGPLVLALLKHRNLYLNRTVGAVGFDGRCHEYARILRDVLKLEVRYRHLPKEKFAMMPFAEAPLKANWFEAQRLYQTDSRIEMIETYALHQGTRQFRQWVTMNSVRLRDLLGSVSQPV
ncbi:hypothetical protein FPE01S_01_08810 [Flavihumibacter petaseus NBRC 106054]|uniref:NmrA-like domain-containing protein n=2 Tax=Flavihumibacter TaxID=1004301 RepID=A0A0E9MWS7_9BACT|nr:hypothetical protein FPE01S_01_08810 [Flavihumibacter petaseus NBRC 106054]